MFKGTILRALFFWLVIIIINQPIISHKDYLLDLIVKANASYIAQKAAAEGMVTPALYQELIDNLTAVGFTADEIQVEYDTAISDRTEIIDVRIRVDRAPMFIYDFSSSSQPTYYYARHRVMSEYLE